jgi:hypothetical protein
MSGPVPDWGGPHAGHARNLYAKLLRDVASGDYPVVTCWRQTLVHSDNRLPALGSDRTSYVFNLPVGTEGAQVTARLIFRRLFQVVAQKKQWDTPDIVISQEIQTPWQRLYLPWIVLPNVRQLTANPPPHKIQSYKQTIIQNSNLCTDVSARLNYY